VNKPRFFEFFAGGGMARAGLSDGWECAFANDFDPMKAAAYRTNWGREHFLLADINDLTADDLPGYADLAWASFPCQDLSLAGNAAGLGTEEVQTRSGAFWAFWRLMLGLQECGRAPAIIVLENVYGVLTANGGRDFALIGRALALAGYRFGALVLDAVHFLPQSRPRVFIVATRGDVVVADRHLAHDRDPRWHPPAMAAAIDRLAESDREQWQWLHVSEPLARVTSLSELIEDVPSGTEWHTPAQTIRLIEMMSPTGRAKLDRMKATGKRVVGTVYRRGRPDATGAIRQRAELRDDQIAGCLRTPRGGSSRQTIVVVDGDNVRSRLLSPREAARLMGLPDSYLLPSRYNDAYHLAGDGLAVPVVRYLAAQLLEPILTTQPSAYAVAAE
jgi:DNA (cytosine-5)-methyltransferase 1